MIMSYKLGNCSNLFVAVQKNGGKHVASVTDYDIPDMGKPTTQGNTSHKREY